MNATKCIHYSFIFPKNPFHFGHQRIPFVSQRIPLNNFTHIQKDRTIRYTVTITHTVVAHGAVWIDDVGVVTAIGQEVLY